MFPYGLRWIVIACLCMHYRAWRCAEWALAVEDTSWNVSLWKNKWFTFVTQIRTEQKKLKGRWGSQAFLANTWGVFFLELRSVVSPAWGKKRRRAEVSSVGLLGMLCAGGEGTIPCSMFSFCTMGNHKSRLWSVQVFPSSSCEMLNHTFFPTTHSFCAQYYIAFPKSWPKRADVPGVLSHQLLAYEQRSHCNGLFNAPLSWVTLGDAWVLITSSIVGDVLWSSRSLKVWSHVYGSSYVSGIREVERRRGRERGRDTWQVTQEYQVSRKLIHNPQIFVTLQIVVLVISRKSNIKCDIFVWLLIYQVLVIFFVWLFISRLGLSANLETNWMPLRPFLFVKSCST